MISNQCQLADRRHFLRVVFQYGITIALAGLSRRALSSDSEMAMIADEERRHQSSAPYKMVIATEYTLEDEVSIPVVQSNFKALLEEKSRGEIAVELRPGGELGLGGALVEQLLNGSVQAAQFSLANLASYVPAIDIINIPYWCGDNQRYVNLVTSAAWTDVIDPKLAKHGLNVLFYYTEDPRVIAKGRTDSGGIVRTPSDMRGLKMRVPNSPVMQQFYRLAGAEPVVVPWGRTLAALREGKAEALDPAVTTLYTMGYGEVLDSISTIASVADAQVYACNVEWLEALPQRLRQAVEEASEQAMAESFRQLPACRAYSMQQMEGFGVQIYKPTASEIAEWVDACGEQRQEWNQLKVDLLGSQQTFDKLKLAAATKGKYTLDDF